jgi:HEAT repeat protein
MNLSALEQQYLAASKTDDFDAHNALVKTLLASSDPEVVEFHYRCLRDRSNRQLYLMLRAAFVERGPAIGSFLLEKAERETDEMLRADLVHLLGRIDHPAAVPMAREALQSSDPNTRHVGCYVLGWHGERSDLALLNERMLKDEDAFVRRTAATAHHQFYEHDKNAKSAVLESLYAGLAAEKDDAVAGWIVLAVQYVLRKRFGIKWNSEEDELEGDIPAAREKCLRALAKLLKK